MLEADDVWKIEYGLFKPYLKERKPKLYTDCFEADWAEMKKLKYKHTTEEEVKTEMAKVYPQLKHAYRYYAGVNPSGVIPSIGQIIAFQFMDDTLNCVDHDKEGRLKPSDIDRLVITVNAGKSSKLNPANQMCRHNFLEWIIRCSIEKFYASKQVETEIEAVKRFLEEFVVPNCVGFDEDNWRKKHTYNVETDNTMRAYLPLWKYLFAKYGASGDGFGKEKSLEMDEFESFVNDSGLINDEMAAREIPICFNQSMYT